MYSRQMFTLPKLASCLVVALIADCRARPRHSKTQSRPPILGWHGMCRFLPGREFALDEGEVHELALIAFLGVGVQQGGGNVIGVGALGIAPDFSVLARILAQIGLAPPVAHLRF